MFVGVREWTVRKKGPRRAHILLESAPEETFKLSIRTLAPRGEGGGRWGDAGAERRLRRYFHAGVVHASREHLRWCLFEISSSAFPPAHSCGVCAGGPGLAEARPAPAALKAASRFGVSDPFSFFFSGSALRLRGCTRAVPRCSKWGPPVIAVHGFPL